MTKSNAQKHPPDAGIAWKTAVAHPDRVRILRHLLEHDTAAPADLAREWSVNLSALSYHFRRLHSLDTIEICRTTHTRSTIKQHFQLRDREATAAALAPIEAHRDRRSKPDAHRDEMLATVVLWLTRVRRRREQLGIPRSKLARRVGVSSGYLGRLERGQGNPRLGLMLMLARELDYPAAELFDDAPDEP